MKEEPIRVAQIIGKWLGGGVESVVMNYYRNIDRTKIQFDFLCSEESTDIPYEELEKMGANVILIPPYQKFFKYHKKLKNVLIDEQYGIVHSHINALSVFSLWAAKCAGIPIRIAHSHSTTNKKEKKKNLIKQILRPFSKIFATHYMCCSELAGRWLFGNKEFDKGYIYVLNNAIELKKFEFNSYKRKTTREKFGILDDTLVIGHVGRFVEQKNHDFLIDIFYGLHNQEKKTVLMLIGQGSLENNILEKVKKLKLEDSVLFLGQRNDVHELYNAMDVFAFPSIYEGLGMVAVEAQVNNLEVVCSNYVPREAAVSNKITFIDLKEKEQWVNILKEKMNNRMKQANFNEEFNKYDIKKQCKCLEEKYLEMLRNEKVIKESKTKN